MRWEISHRADPECIPIADRHYNRQKPGSPQFLPPGRCFALKIKAAGEVVALWGTSWPYAQYVKHAWAGAWMCSVFRNESSYRSSDLIAAAVRATRFYYGTPPPQGFVTFVNLRKVRSSNPGYCYQRAGWEKVGWTKGGLAALQLPPGKILEAEPAIGMEPYQGNPNRKGERG